MSGIHYVAKIDRVREVTLAGTVDLEYWVEVLRPEGVAPLEQNGRAEVMITGVDGRFHGLRFQELNVSVGVEPQGPHDMLDRAFLAAGFNSRPLFAWSERVFFSTPYTHGDVEVELAPPSLHLTRKGLTMLLARKAAVSGPTGTAPDWNGTLFIPSGLHRRFFFARIEGVAHRHPFTTDDELSIDRASAVVLRQLSESHFQPLEWIVRANACHAKSRTYRQSWRELTR